MLITITANFTPLALIVHSERHDFECFINQTFPVTESIPSPE